MVPDAVLGHGGGLPALRRAATQGEGPEKRNLFLYKVTFGFKTKEKQTNKKQCIAYSTTQTDQLRKREGERKERGREGGDV